MPDFRAAGEKAAALLARLMTNPKTRPTSETFGPLRLVRRSSTNRTKRIDREVLATLDLIRRAKAEELLRDPTRDRNAIANLCGYSSANALANFLRRKHV